jgi:hypothetical protein
MALPKESPEATSSGVGLALMERKSRTQREKSEESGVVEVETERVR